MGMAEEVGVWSGEKSRRSKEREVGFSGTNLLATVSKSKGKSQRSKAACEETFRDRCGCGCLYRSADLAADEHDGEG